MNLPSSLALPQSKLLRSRIGIVILVAAAALIGVVGFFVLRVPAPAKLPTAATSPAAQVLPRGGVPAASVAAKPTATSSVVYGPPAPAWVKRDLSVVEPASVVAAAPVVVAAPVVGAPTAVKTVGVGSLPIAAAPAGTAPMATVATAAPVPAQAVPVVPGVSLATMADETPKVLDANALFQREQYVYQAGGRRDPFQSLIDGKYESHSGDGALVDVGDIHLVGIMWGSSDKFALVEDSRGRGFVLRVGDPVVNGYIAGISKTELQVVQNSFGDSQTVTIQLKSKEGEPNATRPSDVYDIFLRLLARRTRRIARRHHGPAQDHVGHTDDQRAQ